MLHDELVEQLKTVDQEIDTIKAFCHNINLEKEFKNLSAQAEQEQFWQNPDHAIILKKLQVIRSQYEQYTYILNTQQELRDLIDLFSTDEKELARLSSEIKQFARLVQQLKIELLLSGENDTQPCFLSINAGAGGTESQDWANMLLRMYIRFCERENLHASIIDIQDGENAGIKSATLYIKGKNTYGLLRSEHGVHRLVRISPFDANKRRHTSFAGVLVIPEMPDTQDTTINPSDLRIDTYRASGAGGQHVNKTESAVRITHLPTNIVVQCQSERSQIQNRATAMSMLHAKLAQKQREEREAYLSSSIEKKAAEWGSQIRSYVLHPYKMVKDHRTGHESPQPDLILDGDLRLFIESYLIDAGKTISTTS